MFTGLIEGQGIVVSLEPRGLCLDLALRPNPGFPEPETCKLGDSVALNGCCLTIAAFRDDAWVFQAGDETLAKTTLGTLQVGSQVNLERALRPTDRLGGHFVQGHVDGTGSVARIERQGEWVHMSFHAPRPLTRQMVMKGSIAVDGVSLTLTAVEDEGFRVALIPHTLQATTLGTRREGDAVNLETDVIGKYIEKMLAGTVLPERK